MHDYAVTAALALYRPGGPGQGDVSGGVATPVNGSGGWGWGKGLMLGADLPAAVTLRRPVSAGMWAKEA